MFELNGLCVTIVDVFGVIVRVGDYQYEDVESSENEFLSFYVQDVE